MELPIVSPAAAFFFLLGYGFGAVDVSGRFGLPPGAAWKSCVDFWVAAAFLLVSAAIASVEVGGRRGGGEERERIINERGGLGRADDLAVRHIF